MRLIPFYIFLLALVLRIAWFGIVLAKNPAGFMLHDSWSYWNIAVNLDQNGVFSQSANLFPDSARTPIYPLFLLFFKNLSFPISGIIVFQLFLSSAACALCAITAAKLFNTKKIAVAAGIFLALDFPSIFFANTILTESVFTFLLLASFLFFLIYFQTLRFHYLLFSALSLGMAALCRPVALYLPFVFAGSLLFLPAKGPIGGRLSAIKNLLLFLLVSYAVVSTWVIRNQLVFKTPFLSDISDTNLLFYTASSIRSEKEGTTMARVQLEYKQFISENFDWSKPEEVGRMENYCLQESTRIIRENPLLFIKNVSVSIVGFFAKPLRNYIDIQLGHSNSYHSLQNRGISLISGLKNVVHKASGIAMVLIIIQMIFLLMMALLAFRYLARGRKILKTPVILLLFTIFYFALASSFTETDARMRMPVMPFICILAGAGIVVNFKSQTPNFNSKISVKRTSKGAI